MLCFPEIRYTGIRQYSPKCHFWYHNRQSATNNATLCLVVHMKVSETRGTAKSSMLIVFIIINHPAIGVPPWLWKPPNTFAKLWGTQGPIQSIAGNGTWIATGWWYEQGVIEKPIINLPSMLEMIQKSYDNFLIWRANTFHHPRYHQPHGYTKKNIPSGVTGF